MRGELRRGENGGVGTIIVDTHAVVESLFGKLNSGVVENGSYEWGTWELDGRGGDIWSRTRSLEGCEKIRKGSKDSYGKCKLVGLFGIEWEFGFLEKRLV